MAECTGSQTDAIAERTKSTAGRTKMKECSAQYLHTAAPRGAWLPQTRFAAALRNPKTAVSCSRRGRASEYAVDLGCQDKVILMQSLDLLSL